MIFAARNNFCSHTLYFILYLPQSLVNRPFSLDDLNAHLCFYSLLIKIKIDHVKEQNRKA